MSTTSRSLSERLLLATSLSLGAPLALWAVMAWAEASRHRARDDWFDIEVFGVAFPLTILVVVIGLALLISCPHSHSVAACAGGSRALRIMQIAPFALATVAACWSAVIGELPFYKIFGFFASGSITLFLVGIPVTLTFIKITSRQAGTNKPVHRMAAPPRGLRIRESQRGRHR
jgi:hypothetical protein